MALPLDLYILSTGYAAHLHSDMENRKEDVTMTLPESETVDRKREEKTQNTDSHNTIILKQPTRLEKTITTLKCNTIKDSTQTIHKSVEKGSLIRIHGLQSLPPSPKRAERKGRRRPFREAGTGHKQWNTVSCVDTFSIISKFSAQNSKI